MFYLYLQISLQGLDLIDDAGRADIASADPRILTHMHPIFARKMLNDPVYYAPSVDCTPGQHNDWNLRSQRNDASTERDAIGRRSRLC